MSDTEVQRPETSASTLLASNDGNGLRAVIYIYICDWPNQGQTERETTERETEHAAARTLQSLSTAACVLSTAACVQHDLGTIKTVWPQDTEMLRSLLAGGDEDSKTCMFMLCLLL